MDIITKMQVDVPRETVFEAFVDPEKIGGFWFSSSSERWEQGKTITLRYEEYDAELNINIERVEDNQLIAFTWGAHPVTIQFEESEAGTVYMKRLDTQYGSNYGSKEGWFMLSCLKVYLEHGVTIRQPIL